MKNFSRDNKRDNNRGGGNFGKKNFGGRGGDRERPNMHKAVCHDCGRNCEVPFKPSGDRPIFCSTCFEKQGKPDSGRSSDRSFQKPSFGEKKMFQAVCDKCGKNCEVPFQPTGSRAVYCSQCFETSGGGAAVGVRNAEQRKDQLDSLHTKLDKILKLLESTGAVKTIKTEKPAEKKKEVKVEKAEKVEEVEKETKKVRKPRKVSTKAKAAPKKKKAKKK